MLKGGVVLLICLILFLCCGFRHIRIDPYSHTIPVFVLPS